MLSLFAIGLVLDCHYRGCASSRPRIGDSKANYIGHTTVETLKEEDNAERMINITKQKLGRSGAAATGKVSSRGGQRQRWLVTL